MPPLLVSGVADLADEFLQQVLQGHHADGAFLGIDHPAQVAARRLQLHHDVADR